MKITEAIASTTITIILTALSGLFGILLGSIYSEVVPIILPTLTQQLPTTVLLKILSVAIILFFLSIGLSLFIYLRYKPKFKTKFGISWGKDKEAYCPSCKIPLGGYTEESQPVFYCHGHGKHVYPMDDHGNPITLSEARKQI